MSTAKETLNILDVQSSLLCRIFDNVIGFDMKARTIRCFRMKNEIGVLYESPVRMLLDDVLPCIEGYLNINIGGESLFSFIKKAETGITPEQKTFHFEFAENGAPRLFIGATISENHYLWFCFSEEFKQAATDKNKIICCGTEREASCCSGSVTDTSRPFVRTFGYFDVYVGGEAILFRSKKAKELLALFMDRRGGYVSSSEAVKRLWPHEEVNQVTLARYRKVAMRLSEILEQNGIGNIMESVDGKRRILIRNIDCDLLDFINNGNQNGMKYPGVYMEGYPWASVTAKILAKM